MKKRCTLILILITLLTFAYAQKKVEDMILLKNGDIVRGKIVEQIPNTLITIKTIDNNLLSFPINKIEKITKDTINVVSVFKSSFLGFGEVGYAWKVNSNGEDIFKLNLMYGYRFNPYFYFGIGSGFRYYFQPNSFEFGIPLFVNFKAPNNKPQISNLKIQF